MKARERELSPLVTVAMAVYNVGKYLGAAIECIHNQSYQNLEILIIDDGSNDESASIAERYAKTDKRIRLISHQENRGLSVRRNESISEARGKYILMLDGDDLFHRDMVSHAVKKAMESDADMVLWDYEVFADKIDMAAAFNAVSALSQINPEEKVKLIRRPAFTWVRLLRLDCLKELGICFESGLTKQDIPVHWRLVTELKMIALLPEKLSYYRLQPNATSCRKGRSLFSLARVMDIVESDLKSKGLYEEYRAEFLRSRLSLLHGMYDFIRPELKAEAMQMINERLNDDEMTFIELGGDLLSRRTRLFYKMIQGNLWARAQYDSIMLIRSIYRTLK